MTCAAYLRETNDRRLRANYIIYFMMEIALVDPDLTKRHIERVMKHSTFEQINAESLFNFCTHLLLEVLEFRIFRLC